VARSYGRIFATIWDDKDFQARSPMAQRMYLFLVSQADLEHSGVIPLRERRWANACGALDASQIADDLKELEASRFVVIDEDSEELLVRSLIRRDEIWKQPNVFKSALGGVTAVKSARIRAALAGELQRLDLSGDLARLRDATLTALEPFENPSGTLSEPLQDPCGPIPEPPQAPSGPPPEPPPEGSQTQKTQDPGPGQETAGQNPSGTLSEPLAKGGEGATEEGERNVSTGAGALPLLPFPFPLPPSAGGASAPTAQTILASFIDWDRANGGQLTKRSIGQIGKTISDLLEQNIHDRHIRCGLADWRASGQNPATLDSFVNAAMKGTSPSRRLATTDQRIADAQALKAKLAARSQEPT